MMSLRILQAGITPRSSGRLDMSTLATGYESKKRLTCDLSAKAIVFPYLRYLMASAS